MTPTVWSPAERRGFRGLRSIPIALALGCLTMTVPACRAATGDVAAAYDVVIVNGRVIDPESATDGVLNVGISGGTIRYVGTDVVSGREAIDARGHVVSPGFIDTDSYPHLARFSVHDGVTSALDLRSGTADVEAWYAEHAGRIVINLGVSAGYEPIREAVMGASGSLDLERLQPASDAQRTEIAQRIRHGLEAGALAVGLGFSRRWGPPPRELREMLGVAEQYKAHVVATMPDVIWDRTDVPAILGEIIDAASTAHAAVHIPHLNSSGGPHVHRLLAMMEEARRRGVQIAAEDSPYRESLGVVQPFDLDSSDAQLGEYEVLATGERLSRQNVARHVAARTDVIVHNSWTEPFVVQSISSPLVSIASHGSVDPARGHPRTAGTFSRVLGRYVREQHALPLNEAIRKMTLMPAQRLEARVPGMRNKGRIRIGADADIVVLDADRVIDRASLKEPTLAPEGIDYVLVNGVVVITQGREVDGAYPGRPIRAAQSQSR